MGNRVSTYGEFMSFDLQTLMHRLEQAQAAQNRALCLAEGGTSVPLAGGHALFRKEGHPLNQALGQVEPLTHEALDQAEALLGRGGHPTVLEVCPILTDDSWKVLAARGYRVQQFQHLLARPLGEDAFSVSCEVRRVRSHEFETFSKVVSASFAGLDAWQEHVPFFTLPPTEGVSSWMVSVDGAPAGGGTLGLFDGVALLAGDGVLPRFRGRGLQKALIAARLKWAVAAGAEWACASTLPSTHSQRAYEACGFRVMYPKVEMAKG
jgi:GNAT superfamily N-acetyltransferase